MERRVLTTVVFLSLVLLTDCGLFNLSRFGGGAKWNHLKVKYTPFCNGLFNIPLSVDGIGNEYVFLKAHEEFPLVSIYCYPDDPRVCPFYDDHGRVAGLRVAYITDDLQKRTAKGKKFPYSYDDKPIFKKGSAYKKNFYYIDVLFLSPDSLTAGGPATREEAVGTGVYLNMDGKTWTAMPRKQEDTKNTPFTKQACFLGMGLHYFYKMSKNMRCEDHQPPFLLYHGGELIGIGLIPFGTFSKEKREWFEDPPKAVINMIVPQAPKCLAEWVRAYGTTSLHIYFREFTRLTCVL